MRCVQFRRLLVVVSALGMVPATLLIIGSGVTRHSLQLENLLGPDPNWMSRMEARMASRRKSLREACHRTGLDRTGTDRLHKPDPWEYLVSTKHHLVWCNVFKAASTSWMYNFNILAGYTPEFLKNSKAVPLELARKSYGRPSLKSLREALDSSVSFLIVRHPLERLLSAYRDKMVFALPNSHHDKLGARIIQRYRRKGPDGKVSHEPKAPTFEEFVRYLLDEARVGARLDMHWTSVAEFCTPCQFNIDIVARFETLEEDQNFLIYKAKLQDYIQPEWKNQAKGSTPTSDLITTHYSQLTQQQIKKLYEIFEYDFQLFGYSLEGYLELGKPEPTNANDKDGGD